MTAQVKKIKDRPLKLLLVDDNPIDLETLEYLLKKSKGQKFDWAKSRRGNDALALCKEQKFDCALLDVNLPDMSGLEFLKEAEARGLDVPCIILSGLDCSATEEQAIRSGAYGHLIKGNVTEVDLERSIRYAVEKAEKFRTLRSSEHQAKTANEAKSEFVQRVSDEVVKSIQNITWMAGLLLEKDPQRLSYEQMSYLRKIQTESKALSRQMSALLELVMIRTNPSEVHLPSFLLGIVNAHKPLAKVNGLALDLCVNRDVPETLLTDVEVLGQVIKTCLAYLLTFPNPGRVRLIVDEGKVETEEGGQLQEIPVTNFLLSYRGAGHLDDEPSEALVLEAGQSRIPSADGMPEHSLAIMTELARLLGGWLKVDTLLDVGIDVHFVLPRHGGKF